MSAGLHVKRPIFMFGFIGSQFFSTDLVSSTVWSFMKSRQARDELLHADGRTDRRGRANIRSEGALAWVYVVISLCGRLPRWTRLLFSVRYALRLYATVAVVTSCVLCAVRNWSNMKILCFIKMYLKINCPLIFQTIVDVFVSYSECDLMLSRPIAGPHPILTYKCV